MFRVFCGDPDWKSPVSASLRRLPQLDAVALSVLDPGEFAVLGRLDALGVDPDFLLLQGGDHLLQVRDAVVDHVALPALPEIFRVGLKQAPDGRALLLGVLRVAPVEAAAGPLVADVEPEMLLVPTTQLPRKPQAWKLINWIKKR